MDYVRKVEAWELGFEFKVPGDDRAYTYYM